MAGMEIRPEIMHCRRVAHRHSRWEWPRQAEPTAMQKKDWVEALGKHLLTQGSKQLLQLKTRLGKWHTKPSMEWDSNIHTQTKTLWKYSRDTGVWLTHRDISHQPTRMKFDISSIGSDQRQGSPPTDRLPCDVLQTRRIQFRLREHAAPLLAPTQQIYKVIIKELPFHHFRLLEHLHFAKSGKALGYSVI
jgi:hypothetical protein